VTVVSIPCCSLPADTPCRVLPHEVKRLPRANNIDRRSFCGHEELRREPSLHRNGRVHKIHIVKTSAPLSNVLFLRDADEIIIVRERGEVNTVRCLSVVISPPLQVSAICNV